jgi:hypothetical protein
MATTSDEIEDILYGFAVEPTHDRQTLEKYLRDHPILAADLIDLSYELSREMLEDEAPLSGEDLALVERGLERLVEAMIRGH